ELDRLDLAEELEALQADLLVEGHAEQAPELHVRPARSAVCRLGGFDAIRKIEDVVVMLEAETGLESQDVRIDFGKAGGARDEVLLADRLALCLRREGQQRRQEDGQSAGGIRAHMCPLRNRAYVGRGPGVNIWPGRSAVSTNRGLNPQ